ncbi:histidine phosphatase family protein [Aliiroseovarius sp. YM-037]|uniref:histidine phosphatase family protein n=1 Tax=Aliiroseovarius sp. YM-037 TaxID=3341728 RepID=UPI003A7FA5BD
MMDVRVTHPLFVLRHGQTEWNLDGRLQGRRDSPLTALGRAQAEQQRGLLRQVAADHPNLKIYCSPLGRARQTAEIATAGLGLAFEVDARLQEVSAGAWEGLTRDEVRLRLNNADLGEFEMFTNAPEGESFNALYDRCAVFLAELSGPTAVVTHGITGSVLRGILLRLSVDEMEHLPREQGRIYAVSGGQEVLI